MMGQYPRRGRTEQTDAFGDVVAVLLWGAGVLFAVLLALWSWTPFWKLFVPHFSWLP